MRTRILFMTVASFVWMSLFQSAIAQRTNATPILTLLDPDAQDQDDMCIWVHPTEPSRSTIIVSDKDVLKMFVYNVEGKTVQKFDVPGKCGNIDVRYGFPLGDAPVDIVAYIDRDMEIIVIYKVDPEDGQLTRVDDGSLTKADGSGMTLYYSARTDQYYAFSSSGQQYRLKDNGRGKITGELVRDLGAKDVEGCAADDETGFLYMGEQGGGLWRYGAEPEDSPEGTLIVELGDYGLVPDIEGVAVYYKEGGHGYIIISAQGNHAFYVYNRRPPHEYMTSFTMDGVLESDGIDVVSISLGPNFPDGAFMAHNGAGSRCPVDVIAFEDIGLPADNTYGDPRRFLSRRRATLPEIAQVSDRAGKWRVEVGPAGNEVYIGLAGEKEDLRALQRLTKEELWPEPTEAMMRWAKLLAPQTEFVESDYDREQYPPELALKMRRKPETFEIRFLSNGDLVSINYEYEDAKTDFEEAAGDYKVMGGKMDVIAPNAAPERMLQVLATIYPQTVPSNAWTIDSAAGKRFVVQVGSIVFYGTPEGAIRSAGRVDDGGLKVVDPSVPEEEKKMGNVPEPGPNEILAAYDGRFNVPERIRNLLNERPKNRRHRYVVMSGGGGRREVVEAMLQHIQSLDPKPVFIISTGDMVLTGDPVEYRDLLLPVLKTTNIPYFPAVGDQDDGRNGMAAAFTHLFGSQALNYSFDYGNSRYIFLDTVTRVRPHAATLAWLQQNLASTPSGFRKYVIAHKPPSSIPKWAYDGWHLRDSRAFTALMTAHDVSHVYLGHIHAYSTERHNGIDYTVSGSGGTSAKGYFGPDGKTPHYIICDVDERSLTQQIVRFFEN